jgi:hypothetical protein
MRLHRQPRLGTSWCWRYDALMFIQVATVSAVVLAVGLMPAVAHADSQDDKYLAALASQGITGDPGQLIADGHQACDAYGGPGVIGLMSGLMAGGLSNVQASNVMLTGIKAYCPEKTPLGGL